MPRRPAPQSPAELKARDAVTTSLVLAEGFRVRTDCPHLANLLERLYPCHREASGGEPSVDVLLHGTTARVTAAEHSFAGREVVIQRDPVVQRFHRTGRQRVTLDRVLTWVAASGTLIEATPGGRVVVLGRCAGSDDSVIAAYENNDAFRVVRHALYHHLLARGQAWAHAASLAFDDGVHLLLGDSRAGKTTSLIHLLRSGAASFLSNGRTLLSLDQALVATAYPEVVMLRQATMRDCAELAQQSGTASCGLGGWEAPEHTKVPILGADFARALGVPTAANGRVRAVILPFLGRGTCRQPPRIPDEEFDDIAARNITERTLEAREEYSWIFGGTSPCGPRSGLSEVLAAVRLLPRHAAYLDPSERFRVHPPLMSSRARAT